MKRYIEYRRCLFVNVENETEPQLVVIYDGQLENSKLLFGNLYHIAISKFLENEEKELNKICSPPYKKVVMSNGEVGSVLCGHCFVKGKVRDPFPFSTSKYTKAHYSQCYECRKISYSFY